MSQKPDGTNPYGRLLDVMRNASPSVNVIVKGEYQGDGKFLIGAHTFNKDEVLLVQNEITIDGKTFKIPGLTEQKHTVKRTVTHYHYDSDSDKNHEVEESFEFEVSVPQLKKGDPVIAYQFGNEEYVVIGKVVG